jgi:hypothetical protein
MVDRRGRARAGKAWVTRLRRPDKAAASRAELVAPALRCEWWSHPVCCTNRFGSHAARGGLLNHRTTSFGFLFMHEISSPPTLSEYQEGMATRRLIHLT